ncbi:hypothetical protein B0T21DRAFT_372421 [Apiosordaria backusii]|uniref:Pre-mRNA-splicing factor 38B n=1 Tax=Apiosordaria backusii TaxID=314023 RepID=A0AA40AXD0_9PEZI|nr:hypothetical protein B0T21DRAFT_372421 [Apiosordaria backusii]
MANDTLLTDDYVAGLLAKEASEASIKYSSVGLEAFRSTKHDSLQPLTSTKPANKAKPNINFLGRIIKETTNHNKALLAKEAAEAKARLDHLTEVEAKKRQRLNPTKSDIRRRQLGAISSILQGGKGGQGSRSKTDRESLRDCKSDKKERCSSSSKTNHAQSRETNRSNNKDCQWSRRKAEDDTKHSHHRRSDRSRSRSPGHRERRYRDRSPLHSDPEDTRHRHSRSHKRRSEKDGRDRDSRADKRHRHEDHDNKRHRHEDHDNKRHRHEDRDNKRYKHEDRDGHRHSRSSRRSSRRSRFDRHLDEEDPYPLDELIGPAPPPQDSPALPLQDSPPPVRIRGRGASALRRGAAAMDSRFAEDYDPKNDVALDDHLKEEASSSNTWDSAVELFRDRQKWKQQGADRLRTAGFTEKQIRKWEKSGEGGERDDFESFKWIKKGQEREWDRGKGQSDSEMDME